MKKKTTKAIEFPEGDYVLQLRHRIQCVRTATGQGYGHKPSLEHFTGASTAQIAYLKPVVDAIEAGHFGKEWKKDQVLAEMHEEYHALVELCQEAKKIIDDKSIEGVDIRKPKS